MTAITLVLSRFGLRTALLAPLALLLVVLIIVSTATLYYAERRQTKEDADHDFQTAQRVFETAVQVEAQKLSAALELIVRDRDLVRAMTSGDRTELLRLAAPAFESLRTGYGITHYYLSGPDRINWLRVHQPERHGDRIDRFTTLEVERTGRPATGLELGPLGTFTLRVVFPLHDGDRLIGYVELGEEIESVVESIHRTLGTDPYFLIDKKLLDPKAWHQGMKMLGRESDWDFLSDVVVTSQPARSMDTSLIAYLAARQPAEQVDAESVWQQRVFRTTAPVLRDAGGRTVGRMLMVRDVTARVDDARRQLTLLAATVLLLGGALFVFFRVLIGRIEQRLDESSRATRDALERSQRQLEAVGKLSAAPALIAGQTSLFAKQLTEEACLAFSVDQAGVWLFDETQERLVCLDQHVSALRSHLSGMTIERQGHPDFFQVLGTARYLLIDDIRGDLRFAGLEKAFPEANGVTTWLFAVIYLSGRDVGLLALGHIGAPRRWHGDEISFACQLADKLALAIMTGRREQVEQERQRLQGQLYQAQKMDAIGQLTGGIAHDFNNMLTTILGYTTLALQRFVPDRESKLAEYLGHVVTSGERARDLIAKMLAFSRLRNPQAAVAVSPAPLVEEVVKMLTASIPSTIVIGAAIDSDAPSIMIEPVELHQLVVNLVINARDAIAVEQGRIDITLRSVTQIRSRCTACGETIEGPFVELAVRDSGSGIPPENISRIFDPFFTTKEVGKGTGMGLSMIHGIMHERKGHILVESGAQGTSMRLLFPVATSRPDGKLASSPLAQNATPATGSRILVVDDEPVLSSYLAELLDTHGYCATAFTDSRAALHCFEQDPDAFDAVVTDQTMPGLTGIQMAEAMLKQRPDLPIVLVTGFSEHLDEAEALRRGVSAFIHKPIASAQLFESLRKLIK